MADNTLIDVERLAGLIGERDVAVVDCRFDLADTSAGERAYETSHIPGAVYAHLDRDLSGEKTGSNGRHPLPRPADLAAALSRLGIDGSVRVVAYDQNSAMWSARLWWLLRWMGHTAVAVLDGGFDAWIAAGLPTRNGVETRAPRAFAGAPDNSRVLSSDAVRRQLGSSAQVLIDVRAPERYRGEVEPIDPVPGHIPGAVNHFFQWNLKDGRFRSPDELRGMLREIAGGDRADRVVCYCGSGVTACQTLLAFEHAGLPGAKLYAGSWSEWIADPRRPIERGEERPGQVRLKPDATPEKPDSYD